MGVEAERRGRSMRGRALIGVAVLGIVLAAGLAAWGTGRGGGELAVERLGAQAGIYEVNHTYRAGVGDITGNELDDLVVIPHWADFPRFYVNQGDGTFEDIAATHFREERVGPRDRHDCPVGDVTGNGRADIFCTTGGKKGGRGAAPSELWLQQEDGTFEHWRDVDDFDLGPARDAYGRSRDALFLDANGNGHLDLYIQNAYPRKDGRSGVSRLFINEDGERYVRAREHGMRGANVLVGGSNLQAIDSNGNGWTDIVACGKEGIFIFRNLEGRDFREVGDRRQGRRSCVWAELATMDRSGRPALVRLNRQALTVHEQDENGRFGPAVYRRDIDDGVGLATGDANGNGLDDIYVVRQGPMGSDGEPTPDEDEPDFVLINRGGGTEFELLTVPQPADRGTASASEPQARGDTVTAIDHDGNGRAAFVVLSGYRKARGPVELIALQGR